MSAPVNPALVAPGMGPVVTPATDTPPATTPGAPSFAGAIARSAHSVSFSNHALQRLQRRGIDIDALTLQRLDGGVLRAAAKGSRDAVVLVDQTAFVVSVANRTVVTAVGRQHMRDHVFTNIDSAVIA